MHYLCRGPCTGRALDAKVDWHVSFECRERFRPIKNRDATLELLRQVPNLHNCLDSLRLIVGWATVARACRT